MTWQRSICPYVTQKLPPRPLIFPFLPVDPETSRIRVEWVERQRNLNQHSYQAHAHQFQPIIFCEQDGGSHRLGTQQWKARASDLFLIAPDELHDADTLEQLPAILKKIVLQDNPPLILP